jgi:hypothetical protein
MTEVITLFLAICCGFAVILGLLAVTLMGTQFALGMTGLAYHRPKQFLYFLYAGSVVPGFMLLLDYFFPEQEFVWDQRELVFGLFLTYSLAVILFHLMDFLWQMWDLGNLEEPPKYRWGITWCLFWNSGMYITFFPIYDVFDMIELSVYGAMSFLGGCGMLFWVYQQYKTTPQEGDGVSNDV